MLDENKKVFTEKRNFCTNPVKKGKGPDVYFKNMVYEDKDTQKRVKELAEKDEVKYMEKVKARMKKSGGEYKPTFMPCGPQEYVELY